VKLVQLHLLAAIALSLLTSPLYSATLFTGLHATNQSDFMLNTPPILPIKPTSNGSDGAFAPLLDTQLFPGVEGVFNFTYINIPENVTVTINANDITTHSLSLLAAEHISIAGNLLIQADQLNLNSPKINLSGRIEISSITQPSPANPTPPNNNLPLPTHASITLMTAGGIQVATGESDLSLEAKDIPLFPLDPDELVILDPSAIHPVPAPAALWLFTSALLGIVNIRRCKT